MGATVPGIAAMMTGVEAITLGLAAALAVGTIAFRATEPPLAALALRTAAAVGFSLALLHWGRWLPW
jgi:CBS-domain-containing membrane protein